MDGAGRVWIFPDATMPSSAETETENRKLKLEQESNRQKTMQGIDERLHLAVDGESLGER